VGVDRPLDVRRRLDLLAAQARVGHRFVCAHDVQPGAQPRGQLDRPPQRGVGGVGAVRADQDRPEHQASLVIAITIPASTKTTIATCIQNQ
jgi:hypothetical protein